MDVQHRMTADGKVRRIQEQWFANKQLLLLVSELVVLTFAFF